MIIRIGLTQNKLLIYFLIIEILVININCILKSSNSLRIFSNTKFMFLAVINHWIAYIWPLNEYFLKFLFIFLPLNYLLIAIFIKNVSSFEFFYETFFVFWLNHTIDSLGFNWFLLIIFTNQIHLPNCSLCFCFNHFNSILLFENKVGFRIFVLWIFLLLWNHFLIMF